MKALPWITLAICASFLVFQQASISSTTRSQRDLEARIAKAESSPLRKLPANDRADPTTGSKGSGPHGATGRTDADLPQSLAEIDLADLARSMMQAQGREIANLKIMMRVQSLILEADPGQLVDLIQRTEALEEIPDEMKSRLIGELVDGLADQDPRKALEVAFASEVLDLGHRGWQFTNAFGKWVKQDPAAAIAWYDRQLAEGTFESRTLDGAQDRRLEFETTTIRSLLSTDPGRARQRILDLSETQRRAILDEGFAPTGENAVAHAELIRASIPAEEQAGVLASTTRNFLHNRDYDDLTAYTEEIGASDAERGAIVGEAVMRQFERIGWEGRTPTTEDLSGMRDYLQAQVPEKADQLTGSALARFGRNRENFAQALEIVNDLQQSSPSDDVLVGFLQTSNIREDNREAALDLAGRITDPARRDKVLERLGQ